MLHILAHIFGWITLMVVLTQCRNANGNCDTQPLPDTSLVYFVNETKPEPAKLTRVCF
jgi:hypothetical protein